MTVQDNPEDFYREVVRVARVLRGNPALIQEDPGCYGRGNGDDWHAGIPEAGGNHHFVAHPHADDEAASEATRQQCVSMLRVGYGDLAFDPPQLVVNWFVGWGGIGTLIGTRPGNHFGKGDPDALARALADLPPGAPHPPNNNGAANNRVSGKETQHMGDSSPYSDALIETLVCIDAAECIVGGWSANRQLMHYTWTNRKEDMSWRGGPDGDGQAELIRRVQAKITAYRNGTLTTKPAPPTDWFDEIMADPAKVAEFKADTVDALVTTITKILHEPGTKDLTHAFEIANNRVIHKIHADRTPNK